MKSKEYNQILAAAYNAAIEIPDIAEALRMNNVAYLYDAKDVRGAAFGRTALQIPKIRKLRFCAS